MERSTILIGLTLFTLLCGLAVAAYQLWSAERSKQKGPHSRLAARYGRQADPAEADAPTQPGLDHLPMRSEPAREPAQTEFGG